jgi:hypothetical protein
VIGPLQIHQDVAADRPAPVDQEVLEDSPCFETVPPNHMPAGHAQLERPQYERRDIRFRRARREQRLA